MEWFRGDSLGCGSSSTVNLAVPKKNSVQYPSLMAVKSCQVSDSALLKNEKDILNQLGNHPQIIQCFGDDGSVENGVNLYNLLLEYAPGGSLSNQLKKSGGRFQESDVKRYTRSILKGLCHVHAKGFAHCDLKLQNILVFENGEAKIADFGLAKKTGQKQSQEEQRKGEIRGTPMYMAPESVNENKYESACDVWALGCAVVEMVTGKPAWNVKPDTHVAVLLFRIGVKDELPIIPEELSNEGKDFLSKCFVKDPTKRWTASMLLDHPFVAVGGNNGGDNNKSIVSLKDVNQGLPGSPRCPFDFTDLVSSQSSSQESELWADSNVKSTLFQDCLFSLADRIRQLVGDQGCNWSDSGSWVVVR